MCSFRVIFSLPWVPEVIFFFFASEASEQRGEAASTSEAIDIPSYNTSTGLWNQGVFSFDEKLYRYLNSGENMKARLVRLRQ